jgi:HK97 family phage major capsid protein
MSKEETTTVEKEFELDETAAAEIAKHVKAPEVDVDSIADAVAKKMEAREKAVEKELVDGKAKTQKVADMPKEVAFVEQVKALLSGNTAKLAELNHVALQKQMDKGLISKTGIHSSGVVADGGALVPDPDFLMDITEALKTYGDISRITQSYNVNSDSVRKSSLISRPAFTKVNDEGGNKTSTKATFQKDVVELEEYAGFTVITDQLLSDSAFDVYNILVQQFAEAAAEVEDQVIFDAVTGHEDILTQEFANLAAFTLDELVQGQYKVPVKSQRGGTTVLSRSALSQMRRERDASGSGYLWGVGPNAGEPRDPWGNPLVMSELLATEDAADTVYGLFGNFSRYAWLLRKNGMTIDLFNSGTVTTADSTVHNLIQQNKKALRVMIRRAALVPLGDAFIQYKTAS